jgi:hypothetical protein
MVVSMALSCKTTFSLAICDNEGSSHTVYLELLPKKAVAVKSSF